MDFFIIFGVVFLIFCLDEMAQINKINLPPNPKFKDKAFKSIKYSHFKKDVFINFHPFF